ncbi:hypothetical protein [Escherichia phage KW1E_UTAR]|nr:hypothetical protein [Escherichia phage KW1E_UTAR]
MSSFHYRSAVMSAARNLALLVRPGVLLSWHVVLQDGDLFIRDGKIVRCKGVVRSLTGANVVRFSAIDGSKSGSLYAGENDRVEKLDLIGYSDIIRFLNGTQPQFIRDVAQHYVEYAVAQNTVAIDGELIPPRVTVNGERVQVMTPAQRERERRKNETPEQAAERRRKNRDNMRRKRALNKS